MDTCVFCNKPVDEEGDDYAAYGVSHAHLSCSERYAGEGMPASRYDRADSCRQSQLLTIQS